MSAAVPVRLRAPLRHDRAAHRGGTEGDEKGREQQHECDARGAVGEDQLAQMRGVEPEQPADQKRCRAGADREIDGEQAEQGDAEQGAARVGVELSLGIGDRLMLARRID